MSRAAIFFGCAHALRLLRAAASSAPLSERQAGDPCSANSAAPQGCVGQGYGAAGPMSTLVQPVPVAIARNRAAWLSVAAFLQPLSDSQLVALARRIGAASGQRAEGAPLAGEASALAAAGAPAIPDGNHGDNNHQQCPQRSENKE